ncbi:MAG: sterol desaturase/sphingolipid hydroxylase (fatty acid hydroxylase superfamily) [Crocinitomix sp.]|jgi:sterol desaturase/sphingolipid hydroxylase (fatty acid hydroxylase superfamily)
MKGILKYVFYPLTILLSVLVGILLFNVLDQAYFIFIPVIVIIPLIGIFVWLEIKFPFQKKWNISKGDVGSDLIRTFFVLPIASKLAELLLPVLLYYPLIYLTKQFSGTVLNPEWGIVVNLIIALLLSELCYYWMHRLSHQNKRLWRLHAVHHGAERVYWANSGRFHFIDAFLGSLTYFLPLVLLGASEEILVLVLTISTVTGMLEHVNINFKAGILNYIFNTAELHRWHHSEKIHESSSNFGKVLVVWDLIFGSYLWPKDRMIERVGIEEEKVPVDFLTQITYPFKSKIK